MLSSEYTTSVVKQKRVERLRVKAAKTDIMKTVLKSQVPFGRPSATYHGYVALV